MPSRRSSVPPWRRVLGVLAITAVVTSAAGCSTDSDKKADDASSGTGDLSASAQECVDKATAYLDERGLLPESLPEELTPLSEAPPTGLTITRLTPGSVPTSVALSEKIVEIAPVVGWTGKLVTFDGGVEDANRKALAAIGNSDIVIVDGLPSAALQAPIKAAEEAGVLLILASINEPPQSVPGFGGTPLGGDVSLDLGELAANLFMQATNCEGKAAAFGLPVEALQNQSKSMEEILEAECEECSLSYTDIQFADVGSPAATNAVISKLQSDPSINFAYFTIGDLAVGIKPALQQAGLDVKIGGAIPVPSNLSELKAGENAFWIGVPQGMTAWIHIDTAVRALETGEPTVGDKYPFPIFTPENVESTDPIPVFPADYEEQFKELWQVS